jgi:hypothetical protein
MAAGVAIGSATIGAATGVAPRLQNGASAWATSAGFW